MMAVAILMRALLSASSVMLTDVAFSSDRLLFFMLRWLSGLIGALGLSWMTWQTLKIPNTQSATGILYVAVSSTILGELDADDFDAIGDFKGGNEVLWGISVAVDLLALRR